MDFFSVDNVNTNNVMDTESTIKITLVKIKNKPHTILSGFKVSHDPSVKDDKALLRKLKTQICTTGGHLRDLGNNVEYVLQGNKKTELVTYLLNLGISEEKIHHSGSF